MYTVVFSYIAGYRKDFFMFRVIFISEGILSIGRVTKIHFSLSLRRKFTRLASLHA